MCSIMVGSANEEVPTPVANGRVRQGEPSCSLAALAIKLQTAKGIDEVLDPCACNGVLEMGFQRVRSALGWQAQAEVSDLGEMSVVLPGVTSSDEVKQVAQRLLELVQRAYIFQGQVHFLQAFAGVAVSCAAGASDEGLRAQAATALKVASLKEAGTVAVFDDEMLQRARARQALVADLRKALPLRQLEVYYQPQVLLPSRELIGFEALLRWRHPELGSISPDTFIPLAEEIGIISNLGNWVLRTACKQLLSLPDTLRMAVNVSPLQLKHGSLYAAVTEVLSRSRLAPSRLELEITEGILLERSGVVSSTLGGLHAMGVRLAIDDFGTGYSSLGQLGHLPFDTIKIDRSLVGEEMTKRTIVRAVAMLGEGLGMSTLIEGLESEQDVVRACEDGCRSAQGYLFSRPVPACQLPKLLEECFLRCRTLDAHKPA